METTLAITGLGLVTCLGADAESTWTGLIEGRSGIGPIRRFETDGCACREGGEAPAVGGDPLAAACAEALRRAGIEGRVPDPPRSGLVVGSSLAAVASCPEFWRSYIEDGPDGARYELLESYAVEPLLDALCRRFDLRGEALLVSNACAAGGSSIALAADLLRLGRADLLLACGADPLELHTYAGFGKLQALAAGPMRPFGSDRDGMKLADGFAALVLEREEDARAAGRRPLARLLGYGESADAHHRTQPDPRGAGAALAMRRALRLAGLQPAAIDHINLHATATPANDTAEFRALYEVFGERLREIPLVASKPALGHTLGAAGTVEAAITLLAIERGALPPTLGLSRLDPEMGSLDLAPVTRDAAVRCAMSNSFGFGGSNTSLIFGACE